MGGRSAGRAAGSRFCGAHISESAGRIFSIWSFIKLYKLYTPEVVQHLVICPILACPQGKNLSIFCTVGVQSERISLKPLGGFAPFEILWNCLYLVLCNVMVACPFDQYELARGPLHISLRPLDWFSPKFYGIVSICICVSGCPFDPYGLVHRLECIYLKLLDGFSLFEVLWNCLHQQLWNCMGICTFAPHGPFHAYLVSLSVCLRHLNFCGIV